MLILCGYAQPFMVKYHFSVLSSFSEKRTQKKGYKYTALVSKTIIFVSSFSFDIILNFRLGIKMLRSAFMQNGDEYVNYLVQ